MSDQPTTLQLELPPTVAQQEVWDLEEQFKQVKGIKTDLQEPKDMIAATLLFFHIVAPYLGQAATVAAGIKTTRELAQILYKFLHPPTHDIEHQQGKNKVVLIKKGVRIELYNLSPEEIEKVLEQ